MTPSYIDRSRDVFGIEFPDFQSTHKTILGEGPFEADDPAKTKVPKVDCATRQAEPATQ